MKSYRYFDLLMASFVAVLLLSNIASSAKIIDWNTSIFGLRLAFDAGTLLFPLSYIFGDILTEVYGFARARRVIWAGFIWSAIMSGAFYLIQKMPGEEEWLGYAGDEAYSAILGGISSGGIIVASLCAYFVGEFSNSYILAKMKIATFGKWLWTRTIGSTLVGQGIDTIVFVLIACAFGVFPCAIAFSLIVANYIFKVGIEVILTPVTYKVIGFLKKAENEDYYDRGTGFNPFSVGK
ncbi:queuosine precursor transporter [Patescibacteria group bacterium]|nr:queuosine precursor transporter [Patescibacteria group bacterium]MBU1123263.1 queuosine precursor transporter [Patescibacteria group bacterium]MBU1911676.1 queuosine precursor transporter [Patescibacteria group bacterium]